MTTPTKLRQSSGGRLLGNPNPTKLCMPDFEYTEIDECIDLCLLGGLKLFPWQEEVVAAWLARDAMGRWAASTCGLSVPRQNGKTLGTVEARANYGMTVLGEEIIYTAHLQKTATETFEDMASFFVDHPSMKKHVKVVREALGREQIQLKNGARIKFLARTRSGGRGQHGSLLIFDEAQELDSSQQASFLFAISAARNPQTIYTGTPPDESTTPGTVFRGIRKRALEGQSTRASWHEWSVDEIPKDRTDRTLWALTNPSLGITIQEQTIESEVDQTDDDEFARERLGWWSESSHVNAVFTEAQWANCLTDMPPKPTDDEVCCLGIKFSADGMYVAVSAAVKQAARLPYVECIFYEPLTVGVSWLADWINKRRQTIAEVVIDGKSNTDALIGGLDKLDYPKKGRRAASTGDVIAASSTLYNAVAEQSVQHSGQPLLIESATKSRRRVIGSKESGGWGFGDGLAPSAPIESVALAFQSVMSTKRNPKRKLRVG